jgi:hypothetical protein
LLYLKAQPDNPALADYDDKHPPAPQSTVELAPRRPAAAKSV